MTTDPQLPDRAQVVIVGGGVTGCRYSRDLYSRLEAETGHSTGFRAVGHLSLATSPERQEALRREAAWMHGFGVEDVEISARNWPAFGRWPPPHPGQVAT
jgi:glycine/D-amino acid oxidase-like deaminating enzyme